MHLCALKTYFLDLLVIRNAELKVIASMARCMNAYYEFLAKPYRSYGPFYPYYMAPQRHSWPSDRNFYNLINRFFLLALCIFYFISNCIIWFCFYSCVSVSLAWLVVYECHFLLFCLKKCFLRKSFSSMSHI